MASGMSEKMKPARQVARASGCASTNSAPNSGVKTTAVSQ